LDKLFVYELHAGSKWRQMKIPPQCRTWQEQMEASPDTGNILKNFQIDTCLPNLEAPFFSALAAKGNPQTPGDARQMSKDVVDAAFDDFVCQGNEVPPAAFQQLLRVCDGKGFANALPREEKEELRDRFTILDDEIENLSYERLHDLIAAFTDPAAAYRGPVSVRGKADLAWVSDRAVFSPDLPGWGELVRQLGLPHYLTTTAGVVFVYSRNAVPHTFHLPRAFDGVDWPPFRIEPDCHAPSGTSEPLLGQPPRPEAVHRGCQIARNQLSLLAWR
jgi:hypothetical protein